MRKQTVTIVEQADGWLNVRTGHVHKTAGHAIRALKAQALRDAKAMGEGVVTVVTWEPSTRVGVMVVKALNSD